MSPQQPEPSLGLCPRPPTQCFQQEAVLPTWEGQRRGAGVAELCVQLPYCRGSWQTRRGRGRWPPHPLHALWGPNASTRARAVLTPPRLYPQGGGMLV